MQKAYSNNGLSFLTVPDTYVAATGEVLFPDIATAAELTAAFPGYTAAAAAQAKDAARAATVAQLAALDAFLPRALEDYWTATSFDTTKLPQIQQTRLAEKQTLRGQLAGET